MTGVMAYVSAPLWLLSLALSTAFVVLEAVVGPQYFVEPRQLFPIWPEWDFHSTLMFTLATAGVLFTAEDPRRRPRAGARCRSLRRPRWA